MTPQQLQEYLGIQLSAYDGTRAEDIIRHQYRNSYLQEGKDIVGLNLLGNDLTDDQIGWLGQLRKLRYLNLSENKLKSFTMPESLGELVLLNLSEQEPLTAFHFPKIRLSKLEKLHLHDCRIKSLEIPEGLQRLQWLDVARNQELEEVSVVGDCPKLDYLDLSANKLSAFTLPVGFARLKYLYLVDNQLERLEFRSDLPQLNTLHLRNNQLKGLPENFLALTGLEVLYLHNNPINQFSPEAIHEDERGNSLQEVRNTLISLQEDPAVPNDEVKLVLLGNSTAGKSSLMRYLKDRIYDEESLSSTHGILNEIWEPEGLLFKVNIWDFGGQEYYHATHRLFLSRNSVTLVLFETKTNKADRIRTMVKIYDDGEIAEREVELEHFPYEYWLHGLRHFCGTTPKSLLVQNKMDKEGATALLIPDAIHREFIIGEEQIHRISIKATAAGGPKKFVHRFEELEEQIKELLAETRSRYPVSAKWLEIKQALRKRASDQKWMSWEEYISFCEKIRPDIAEPLEGGGTLLKTMTSYLHDIGAVLHYPEIEALQNKVFIDPNWLVDTIYKVLDYQVREKEGRFDLAHVERVLKQEPIDPREMLALMQHFELIFSPKSSKNEFVCPQYLPEENPEAETKSFKRDKKLCAYHACSIRFPSFMPRSLMTRLIVKYGNLTEDNFWKHGILFVSQSSSMILLERTSDLQLQIHTNDLFSKDSSELFQTIFELSGKSPAMEVSTDGIDWVSARQLLELPPDNKKVKTVAGVWVPVSRFGHLLEGTPHSSNAKMDEARALISKSDLKSALTFLSEQTDDAEFKSRIAQLHQRLAALAKSKGAGVLSFEDENLARNQISNAILSLAEEMLEDA